MTIDIDQIVERAVERANEKWAEKLPELIRKALDDRDEKLEPLSAAFGIKMSSKAASARLARDPELRKLGVRVGARTLFLKSAVVAYYRAKDAR